MIWGLPIVLLTLTAGLGGLYAAVSWPPVLAFMGGACLVNARRCGRLHCYVTGPYFLLLGGVSLLYSLGVIPLGLWGWRWLTTALLIGSCTLICVPEWLFGRYVRRADTGADGHEQ